MSLTVYIYSYLFESMSISISEIELFKYVTK